MIESLVDPNIAFLLLMLGFWLAMMGLLSPGTGLYELGALLALVLGGVAILVLPVNWWALAVLVFGVLPPLFFARRTGQKTDLAVSMLENFTNSRKE